MEEPNLPLLPLQQVNIFWAVTMRPMGAVRADGFLGLDGTQWNCSKVCAFHNKSVVGRDDHFSKEPLFILLLHLLPKWKKLYLFTRNCSSKQRQQFQIFLLNFTKLEGKAIFEFLTASFLSGRSNFLEILKQCNFKKSQPVMAGWLTSRSLQRNF